MVPRSAKDRLPVDFTALAQSIPGPVTDAVSAIAKEMGTFVVFTLLERDTDSGAYYNSSLLINGDGHILLTHRKTKLTPGIEDGLQRGNNYDVVSTPIGKIGLLICAEATCPEPARIMALKGADLVCLSSGDFFSQWLVDGKDIVPEIWKHCSAAPARAIDNNIFWVATNGAGMQGGTEFFGGSRVFSPLGELLAEAPCGSHSRTIISADLDLAIRDRIAGTFSLMKRRRPELYGDLVTSSSGAD